MQKFSEFMLSSSLQDNLHVNINSNSVSQTGNIMANTEKHLNMSINSMYCICVCVFWYCVDPKCQVSSMHCPGQRERVEEAGHDG